MHDDMFLTTARVCTGTCKMIGCLASIWRAPGSADHEWKSLERLVSHAIALIKNTTYTTTPHTYLRRQTYTIIHHTHLQPLLFPILHLAPLSAR
jgi:hypothetical protein